jgi:two-component system nitrate/nitrite response regulator NarL
MAGSAVNPMLDDAEIVHPDDGAPGIRVILADQQAIFRAGLRKIFALEDDIRVVGQAENLVQTVAAVTKFSADVLIFESALTASPVDTVADLQRKAPRCRIVVVTDAPNQEQTLECFRRGAHAVVSREIEPEKLMDCVRKVAQGEPWLDTQGVHWVLEAYRSQNGRPSGAKPKVNLTPKESLIVACVTQGMKNKEIALRVGTTEQVVKNYLRKVYDKLGVADRLELALFCLHHRVLDESIVPPQRPVVTPAEPIATAAAAGSKPS